MSHTPSPPTPAAWLDENLVRRAAQASRQGLSYRAALEQLLLELDDVSAGRLLMLLREGRAAWLPMISSQRGEALLIGDPLSGAAVPLARLGLKLTILDPGGARSELAAWRDRELGLGSARFVPLEGPARLPFADDSFDLVIRESEAPPLGLPLALELAELERVGRGELAWIVENRLAYKRSSGERASFAVARPLEFLTRALFGSRRGERTAVGYRAALRSPEQTTRPFALYPHSHDYSHVVGLNRAPKLSIGPGEAANRLKLAGLKLGLFPWLTPSFLFLRSSRPESLLDRSLKEIAGELELPALEAEHLIATRGNTSVVLTRSPDEDPRGRLALHIPLSPAQETQTRRHHARLVCLEREFPSVPAPRARFEGRLGGLYLCAEQRLDGWNGSQFTGDLDQRKRLLPQLAKALANLRSSDPQVAGPEDIERLVDRRVRAAAPRAGRPQTQQALEQMGEQLREVLSATPFPRVLHHADLRAKHVQTNRNGDLAGLLDWGSSAISDLPYFDLLNLILHDRKQEHDTSLGEAWELVRTSNGLRPFERAALEDYAERLGLTAAYTRAIETTFPLLVGAMAESNWDFSRPRWIHRSLGI